MPLSDDQRRIAASFPDVVWSQDDRLCLYRPQGKLTHKLAARLIAWLAEIERDNERPFNRFTDLTKFSGSELREFDVQNMAYWRKATYEGPPVQSAILAHRRDSIEPSVALAHTYSLAMSKSQITVKVFDNLADAAVWLGVPRNALEWDKQN